MFAVCLMEYVSQHLIVKVTKMVSNLTMPVLFIIKFWL